MAVDGELRLEQVKTVLDRAVEMVEHEITIETVNELLVSKRTGKPYANFPSKKVKKWAIETQAKYGLEYREDIIEGPLLYACIRRIYKELEFDLGRNYNVGWALTTYMDIEDGLLNVIKSKLRLSKFFLKSDLSEDVRKCFDETVEIIKKHCESVVRTIRNVLLKGISLGALRWYQAFGYPKSIVVMESDEKELKKLFEVDLR